MSRLKGLIQEIHRRSLWQVLGIYLVGAWVAFQGIEALVSVLGLPSVDTETLQDHPEGMPLETDRINEMGGVMQPEEVASAAIRGLQRGSFLIIPNLGGRLLMLANRLAPWLVDRSLERTVARARAEGGL